MTEENFSFQKAASIKIPEEFFNPLVTGIKAVDESWSEIGGIVPSQVTFITGPPGSGKTTLTLAIAATLKRDAAFISLEMSDFQLAYQARKIKGFGAVNVSKDFHQEKTIQILRDLKPSLVIVDSIQKAARKMREEDGRRMPFDRAQFAVTEMFTQFAKETWIPVFLIGHCDKSGNYKGPSDLLHDVDSHLLVHYDKEMDMRTFTFGKNRFGGLPEENLFGISRERVWVGTPYISEAYGEENIEKTPQTQSDPDPEDMVKFCLEDLRKNWNGGTAKALIKAIVEKLKEKDPNSSDTYVKNFKKVKVSFRGNTVAHCHPNSGELVFGKKTFTMMNVGMIGYKKEQKYITARIEHDADLLVWTVIHEWCHLFKDKQTHNNAFFEFVAEKYDWFKTVI